MFNIMDACLGLRKLEERGYSVEAIRKALSKRRYWTANGVEAAGKVEQERIDALKQQEHDDA